MYGNTMVKHFLEKSLGFGTMYGNVMVKHFLKKSLGFGK